MEAGVSALLFGVAAFSYIPCSKGRTVLRSLLLCYESRTQNESLEEISSFSRRRHFVRSLLSKDPSLVAPDLNKAWHGREDLRIGLAYEPCPAEGSSP